MCGLAVWNNDVPDGWQKVEQLWWPFISYNLSNRIRKAQQAWQKVGPFVIFFIRLNMFLVTINMSIFRFSLSKKFLRILVSQKFFIFTFDLSFEVNSYVEFIFLQKIYNIKRISPKKKLEFFNKTWIM